MAMAMAIAGTFLVIGVPLCLNNLPSLDAAPLVPRQLPGFSISLPPGEEKASDRPYYMGRFELTDVAGRGGRIIVRWAPGGEMELTEVEQLAREIAVVAKIELSSTTQWPGPTGTPVQTAVLRKPTGKIWISVMSCGQRRIVIFSDGPEAMGELHRRILPTIACQPVPASEAQLSTLPWTIELPAGWLLVEAPPGRVTLAKGEQGIAVSGGIDPSQHAHLPEVLGTLFSSEGLELTVRWEGDRLAIRSTLDDGLPLVGWAWVLECPMGGVLVMALAGDAAAVAEVSELVTSKGRCLKPGEVAPPWPERQPDPDPDSTTKAAPE